MECSTVYKLAKHLILLGTSLFITLQCIANDIEVSDEEDWGDDDWSEEVISPWKFSGFVETGYG